MLVRWEQLPDFMRIREVRPYYEMLRRHWLGLLMKRTFDFAMSSLMLVLLAPVFLFLAGWIKIDSKGPVFYRQKRVTQYGRIFTIYKFRTMVQNADKIGGLVTVGEDARITKAGKKLRGCRLDELPQLINIWKGEMTFVGTRPEVEKYVKQYTKEMYATLLLPAGVTSAASIEFKDEDRLLTGVSGGDVDSIYIGRVLPGKMEWNLRAISRFHLMDEWKLMIKTVIEVVR